MQDVLQFGVWVRQRGARLSHRALTVSISDVGSLDMPQWNYVMDCVTQLAAKVESILCNHACSETMYSN